VYISATWNLLEIRSSHSCVAEDSSLSICDILLFGKWQVLRAVIFRVKKYEKHFPWTD
jgi:hypothetical protein